jgi:hypothetical protein
MINVNTSGGSPGAWRSKSGEGPVGSRGTSVQGRRSGEIMGITEEEEEEEEEEVEEVETFGGRLGEGEFVEEESGPMTPPKQKV